MHSRFANCLTTFVTYLLASLEFDPSVPMAVSRSKSKNGTVKRSSVKTVSDAADHKVRVKVLYDYEARDEDEISLKQGEFLDEIKPEDDQGEFYSSDSNSCHFCDIQVRTL